MKLIDTHCHPQMGDFDEDREATIRRALDAGIGLIAIGTTIEDSLAGIRLAENFPDQPVFTTIGIHPEDEEAGDFQPAQLQALLGSKKIVGIGETGLDYSRLPDGEGMDIQADLFEQHILLAQQARLPLVVHCRDRQGATEAYEHCASILRRHSFSRFVMHCFSMSWTEAEKFLELGGMISFTGIITFPKSGETQEVVKKIPAEKYLLETDAPFLAPVPERGKRNEPLYVKHVVEKVAELRRATFDEVAQSTTENAIRFFGLSNL